MIIKNYQIKKVNRKVGREIYYQFIFLWYFRQIKVPPAITIANNMPVIEKPSTRNGWVCGFPVVELAASVEEVLFDDVVVDVEDVEVVEGICTITLSQLEIPEYPELL